LLRELGRAGLSEQDNPLLEIARQMREVEGLIRQANSGRRTQDLQGRIVARLDELIRQARSCSGANSPSQAERKIAAQRPIQQPKSKPAPGRGKPNPKRAADSDTQPGKSKPQQPDVDELRQLVKSVWGELPEMEGQPMAEWIGERFLPKYERLIRLYYRRLAEKTRGQGGKQGSHGTIPTPQR
jgi:hypothetical protein